MNFIFNMLGGFGIFWAILSFADELGYFNVHGLWKGILAFLFGTSLYSLVKIREE